MKRIVVAVLGLLPLAALAQDDDTSERMRAAELRLEQAAQEITELSAALAGDSIKHVIKTIRHPGGERRAMLGITISRTEIKHDDGTVEKSGTDPDGIVINGVTPGGPADEAGLESGDVILALNDAQLNSTGLPGDGLPPTKRLTSLLDDIAPGDTVSVRYRRGDFENTVQVVTREFSPMRFAFGGPGENYEFHVSGEDVGFPEILDHFPGIAHLSQHRAWRGLELVTLTPKLGSYFNADRGLLVVGVPDYEGVSLEEGDVILSIAGATPDTPPEAMRMLRFYEPGDEVVIEIRRQKRNKTLKITIPE